MRIAVLSGKGGTGKTLVSVNLATMIGQSTYIDCDVEEPNGNIFFQPTDITHESVSVTLPKWDATLCDGCKKCVDFCAFNALAYVGDKLMVFDEVCHSCGGCELVCPHNAISKRERVVGEITRGRHGDIRVLSGMLNMGEASGVPIIARLLEDEYQGDTVIDCPPGSACTVMESIKEADYCILVAEPSIFGVSNLDMVVRLARLFHKKVGVVLNKCVEGETIAIDYCREHELNVIGKIMWDTELAHISSSGGIAVEQDSRYKAIFSGILENIRSEVMS